MTLASRDVEAAVDTGSKFAASSLSILIPKVILPNDFYYLETAGYVAQQALDAASATFLVADDWDIAFMPRLAELDWQIKSRFPSAAVVLERNAAFDATLFTVRVNYGLTSADADSDASYEGHKQVLEWFLDAITPSEVHLVSLAREFTSTG